VGITTLGYFLGQIEFVRANIEYIIVAIIAVSFIPIASELLRARAKR
jgi:membrane-associated protein